MKKTNATSQWKEGLLFCCFVTTLYQSFIFLLASPGTPGYTGSTGYSGSTGSTGCAGSTGSTLSTGSTGTTSFTGSTGSTGSTAIQLLFPPALPLKPEWMFFSSTDRKVEH